MRLEPVAECAPQHACRRARRSALHDKMPAVKKIGGISGIERERLESWERRELGRSPLPAIAYHAMNSKCARSLREGIHRHWIPTFKVKITEGSVRFHRSPRIRAFFAVRSSVGSAVPLSFGRQRLPCPVGISFCLRLTDVNWPIERQRNVIEHVAIHPLVALRPPECRM